MTNSTISKICGSVSMPGSPCRAAKLSIPLSSKICKSSSSVRASSALTLFSSPIKQMLISEQGQGKTNKSRPKKRFLLTVYMWPDEQSMHGTLSRTLPSGRLMTSSSLCPHEHLSFIMSADSEKMSTTLITPHPQWGQRYATVAFFVSSTILCSPIKICKICKGGE